MTQAEFAKAVGVDQTAVTQWENGKTHPKFYRWAKIIEVLGCTTDDLMNALKEGE